MQDYFWSLRCVCVCGPPHWCNYYLHNDPYPRSKNCSRLLCVAPRDASSFFLFLSLQSSKQLRCWREEEGLNISPVGEFVLKLSLWTPHGLLTAPPPPAVHPSVRPSSLRNFFQMHHVIFLSRWGSAFVLSFILIHRWLLQSTNKVNAQAVTSLL